MVWFEAAEQSCKFHHRLHDLPLSFSLSTTCFNAAFNLNKGAEMTSLLLLPAAPSSVAVAAALPASVAAILEDRSARKCEIFEWASAVVRVRPG